MIIDTSNALAAPGSSRGYACLSVACRSIAPGGASGLLGVRGWGSPRRARRGPPSPQAQTRRRPPSPSAAPAPAPSPRGPCVVTRRVVGGRGARLGERRRKGGAAAREEGEGRESRLGPSSCGRGRRRRGPGSSLRGAPSRRTRLGVRGSSARAGWKVPRRRRRASSAVGACVVVGGGEARSEGLRGENRGRGSASRSPRFAARPWWRPGVRPTAAPAPHLPAAVPRHHRPVLPARSARQGPEARPAARPAALAAAFPGFACPPAVTRGTPWRRPPSRARLRCAAAWCRAGAPSRASAPGACPSLPSPPPPRRGGGGRRRPRLSLARLLPSPGPSPDGASGRAGGRAGERFRPSASPPAHPRPCAPPALRDATSDQTWRPAEFKHISQRRKRN